MVFESTGHPLFAKKLRDKKILIPPGQGKFWLLQQKLNLHARGWKGKVVWRRKPKQISGPEVFIERRERYRKGMLLIQLRVTPFVEREKRGVNNLPRRPEKNNERVVKTIYETLTAGAGGARSWHRNEANELFSFAFWIIVFEAFELVSVC